MTWLELIDELRKQPLHLLEHEVEVWNYIENNGTVTNLVGHGELFTKEDDTSSDDKDWGPDGVCRLSIESYHEVPDSFFTDRRDHDSTYKPKLNEYEVVLRRTSRISVMAADPEQAQRIGERLATGETEFACMVANNTLAVGDDEFWGVSAAGNGFCHARLDEEDSMRILNEEE